jgi:hypothetical protein
VSGASKIKIKHKAGSPLWQVNATLHGEWDAAWVMDGLVNATTNTLVSVPVLLFFNGVEPAVFYTDKALGYQATAGKAGSAK